MNNTHLVVILGLLGAVPAHAQSFSLPSTIYVVGNDQASGITPPPPPTSVEAASYNLKPRMIPNPRYSPSSAFSSSLSCVLGGAGACQPAEIPDPDWVGALSENDFSGYRNWSDSPRGPQFNQRVLGQTFVAQINGHISGFTVALEGVDLSLAGNTVRYSISEVPASGTPSTPIFGNQSFLAQANAWNEVALDVPLTVQQGKTYLLALGTTDYMAGAASDASFYWAYSKNGVYSGGSAYVFESASRFHNGFGAVAKSGDAAFAIAYTELQPVPEPETYIMLLAGLGIVGAATRRKKR